jgi:hypothetical protein
MRFRFAVLALFSCCCQTTRADGLIYELPANGAQARYDIELVATVNGAQQPAGKGTLSIASVGEKEVDNDKCRWIEIKTVIKINDADQISIMKILVPEKHLGKGKSAAANMIQAWVVEGDMPAMEFKDLKDPRTLAIAAFLAGPPKNPGELEKAEIDNPKLGKVQCAGVTGDYELDGPVGLQVPLKIDDRLHKDSPFGLVTANWTFELKVNGQTPVQGTFKLSLTDVNTTALTELPDKN